MPTSSLAGIAESETVDARKLYSQLRTVDVFRELQEEEAGCLGELTLWHVPAGATIYRDGDRIEGFWAVLSGEIRGYKRHEDGTTSFLMRFVAGESFGEVPLLAGKQARVSSCEAVADTVLVGMEEEAFWQMMAACPVVRQAVRSNMEGRLQTYQALTLHREKLISLGILSAGLMHELNNPGTAAKRAASQLRENLVRLQQINLRFCDAPMVGGQWECVRDLQERALAFQRPKAMSSLEQADAEEALCEWLEEAGVENSWKLSPTLTSIGLTSADLECARRVFKGPMLSDTLNWLDSLVSSMQLVGAIEESIARVSELAMAVKKYSHNENESHIHAVDVHEGLQSTLTILGHKFRPKDLKIDKQFSPEVPEIHTRGAGLTQVWTNLLDNAVDASPQGGTIHIRTWVEGKTIGVGIADEGSGISEEHKAMIFQKFFTTKPVGVGTGLGLEIAHRIVVGSYCGEISFTSEPGKTEFVVKLPVGV